LQLQLQRRCSVIDRAGVQPINRRLSLCPQTLSYDQTAIRSPGLPFNGFHSRDACSIMDYYLHVFTRPEGVEGS